MHSTRQETRPAHTCHAAASADCFACLLAVYGDRASVVTYSNGDREITIAFPRS